MRRRGFLAKAAAVLTTRPANAASSHPPYKTDPATGRQYYDTYDYVPGPNGGFVGVTRRIWMGKVRVKVDFTNDQDTNVVVVGKPDPPAPDATPVTNEREAGEVAAKEQADNPDVGVEGPAYSFGAAGAEAAGTAVAYGVAAALAGLPEQAARIAAMQAEVQALQNALANQAATQADVLHTVQATLAAKGSALLNQTSAVATLPVGALQDILETTDQTYLYATPDPYLAARLHGTAVALDKAAPAALPEAPKTLARAMVRQADVESAIGNADSAEGFYRVARLIANVAVGIDPITGVLRSSYELVTGLNLITGEALSPAERAFAAVNLILLGEFGAVDKGLEALAKAGRILGGTEGAAIIRTIAEISQHWPRQVLDQLVSWTAAGSLRAGGEVVELAASKALVPVGAVDGVYARVMDGRFADAVETGGALSKINPDPRIRINTAFITDAKSLDGLTSWDQISRRLGLVMDADPSRYRPFAGEVIVEFKFASNQPLAFLASPFGEVGAFGPAFLPGGYTIGGAPEWVVDAQAASKGLIDLSSIRIRPITR